MRTKDFAKLVSSIKQAGQIRRGGFKASRTFEVCPPDIRAIRQKLGRSQSEFALMIGVSVSTLQNWEQGRRRPVGPAQGAVERRGLQPTHRRAGSSLVIGERSNSAFQRPGFAGR